ncbi:UNVERIFIED_ORG: putative HicB family RNase H-like nuclease [Rhizobium nepotum]|nr:putative HicB family RNase H-like nuclease [Rhizobium nepotum]
MESIAGKRSDQFNLRLPDGMRTTLKQKAEQNRRSLNAEIIVCIERALTENCETKKADARA